MRLITLLPLILGCAVATTAFADPAGVARNDAPPAPTTQKPKPENPEAAAALAVAVRMQQEQERHVAEGLCRAGDQSKCEALKAMPAPQPQ